MCIHQHILPRILLFNTKLQETQEKGSSQKSDKEKIEKLTLSKKGILAHVHNMIDEDIEMIYDIKAANSSTRKCKKALALFNATLTLPDEHAAPFNLLTIPVINFICDAISLQNSDLELIQNFN